ncbi:MAG: Gmad2 immunoglobulin-like domain-containing protein [Deferrisomatales bacterium]|nr:Gmad2 immunoglobulin-like domain-containing protein [Deferrisomatales bacterium]
MGEPTHGDLDGDGVDDTALFLGHDPGGSGTFYYVAVALRRGNGYRGTNAVLLGDRVAPETLVVRNGVLIAGYVDRRAGEPMSASPTVRATAYLVLQGTELVAIAVTGSGSPPGEAVREGWLTIGREARSFSPCGEKKTLRVSGEAPVLAELRDACRRALPDTGPYTPLFAVVAGRYGARPGDGFGAQYDGSFLATRLVRVWPRGNCRSEHVVLEEPTPGQAFTSPLTLRGRARGTWFFEGDFPIELRDARGGIVARHYATARGEWMTQDFVPFEGTLEFPKPERPQPGTLVLRKYNPTDSPARDDAVEIPVMFR